MVELVRNCSAEFKEYYIQMQVAKRSQAPLPSQVTCNTLAWASICFPIKVKSMMKNILNNSDIGCQKILFMLIIKKKNKGGDFYINTFGTIRVCAFTRTRMLGAFISGTFICLNAHVVFFDWCSYLIWFLLWCEGEGWQDNSWQDSWWSSFYLEKQ